MECVVCECKCACVLCVTVWWVCAEHAARACVSPKPLSQTTELGSSLLGLIACIF